MLFGGSGVANLVVMFHCDNDFSFDASFSKIPERFRNIT